MANILILGAGMVGSTMAIDLARDGTHAITLLDRDEAALDRSRQKVEQLTSTPIRTRTADLSDDAALGQLYDGADLVLGALSSVISFNSLRTVIESGTPCVDISFMPENALELDELAKQSGALVIFDCGVAPGFSNMLAALGASRLDSCSSIEIYVGGLPKERRWPFAYKAAFSPYDVIEEYTRPARLVEGGQVVTRPALSEPELIYFPGVGDLEAFNTDGLRSMIDTLDVPDMKEKTLRYPGHIELMRIFRETGFFSHDALDVNGHEIRPIDVTSRLLFPKWTYGEGEADLTVMRVIVRGVQGCKRIEMTWSLFDVLDAQSGCSSMSRTTAFPATIVSRAILDGTLRGEGVLAPEQLVRTPAVIDRVTSGLRDRGVVINEVERETA